MKKFKGLYSLNIKRAFASIGILLLIAIIGILFNHIVGRSICALRYVVGIPCLTCGMTRAYINLINLNIAGAFYYHPLFIVPMLVPILCLFEKEKSKITYFLVILLVVTWIIRMYLYFPDREPFVLNEDALIPTYYRLNNK